MSSAADYPVAGSATRVIVGIAGLAIAIYFVALLAPHIAENPAEALSEPRPYLGVGFLCLTLWPFWFVASGRINTAKAPAWLKYPRWLNSPRRHIAKLVLFCCGLVWMAWSAFTESRSTSQWVWFGLTGLLIIGWLVESIRRRGHAFSGR